VAVAGWQWLVSLECAEAGGSNGVNLVLEVAVLSELCDFFWGSVYFLKKN
jgi:hypothetical protein